MQRISNRPRVPGCPGSMIFRPGYFPSIPSNPGTFGNLYLENGDMCRGSSGTFLKLHCMLRFWYHSLVPGYPGSMIFRPVYIPCIPSHPGTFGEFLSPERWHVPGVKWLFSEIALYAEDFDTTHKLPAAPGPRFSGPDIFQVFQVTRVPLGICISRTVICAEGQVAFFWNYIVCWEFRYHPRIPAARGLRFSGPDIFSYILGKYFLGI